MQSSLSDFENYYRKLDVKFEKIRANTSEAVRYEQLAEECCELSHILLKKARKLRGENYTPISMEEIDKNIKEEWTDVLLTALIAEVKYDEFIFGDKLNRWILRTMAGEQ